MLKVSKMLFLSYMLVRYSSRLCSLNLNYKGQELPTVQVRFKGTRTNDITWAMEKEKAFQKDICFLLYSLLSKCFWLCWSSSRCYLLRLKMHKDSDYSPEINTYFLFKRKTMTNFWCRDITLTTKMHNVKAMVYPVLSYSCKSWFNRKT